MTRLLSHPPLHTIGVLLLAGMVAIGCDDKAEPEIPNVRIYPDSVSPGVRSSSVPIDTTTHDPVTDTGSVARSVPLDPATGTLELKGSGPFPGTWRFEDVNASMSDRTVGGTTSNILTIEAHKVPPEDHFKLYLIRPGGKVEPGTYTIDKTQGTPPRDLDAAWEHGGKMYRGLQGATGSVELKTLTADHATGEFNISLVPIDGGPPQTLTGSFDMRVQR